ncbi:hypothetical protein V8E36_007531 [Tilletia maclaganii]
MFHLRYGLDARYPSHLDSNIMATAGLVTLYWNELWQRAPTGGMSAASMPATCTIARPALRLTDAESVSSEANTATLVSSVTATVRQVLKAELQSLQSQQSEQPAGLQESADGLPRTQPSGRIPLTHGQALTLIRLNRNIPGYKGPRTTALADGMALVASGGPNICVVTATGAGKSGLWHYASTQTKSTPGKFVLLIVPYNALLEDIKQKCGELGINAAVWEDDESLKTLHKQPSVLIISLNKVVGQHFRTWLQEPRNLARVQKVVFDEAHVLLDERSFRLCIRRVPTLMDTLQGRKTIFLTATMPPKLETEFQNAVMTPVVFRRDLTHLPNVEQNIETYGNKVHLAKRIQLLHDRHTKTPDGKDNGKQTIVWVMTRRDAEQWSTLLDMPAVYSEPDDNQPDGTPPNERTEIFSHFMEGTHKGIVSTPGTACGIDPKQVVLAFFIGGFYSTLFYNQVIGRLMRGGGIGKSYICLPEKRTRHGPPENHLNPTTDDEAKRGILSDVYCLNECMQAWVDGRQAKCVELSCEPCSVCRRNLEPLHAPPSQPDDSDDSDSSSPTASRDKGPFHKDGKTDSKSSNAAPTTKRANPYKETDHAHKKPKAAAGEPPAEGIAAHDNVSRTATPGTTGIASRTPVTREPVVMSDRMVPPTNPVALSNRMLVRGPSVSTVPTTPTRTQASTISNSTPARDRTQGGPSTTGPTSNRGDAKDGDASQASGATATRREAGTRPASSVPRQASTRALNDANRTEATTQSGLAIQRYFSDQRYRTQSNQHGSSSNQTVQPRAGPSRLPAQPFVSCQQQAVFSAHTGSTANAAPGSASELSVAPNAIAGPSTSLGTSRPFNYTGNVQDWAEYQRGIQAGLERCQSRCPMCFMLRRPDNHPPAACTAQYLDYASQRDFRKHESNDWSYGVACFFCHLPQDICKRRNSERTCVYSQYRDAVRGILMMLTAYPDMLRDASDLATVINPGYTIGEPDAPLRVGDEWRELTYYHNVPGYKAFQLVAAVLLLFANWRL